MSYVEDEGIDGYDMDNIVDYGFWTDKYGNRRKLSALNRAYLENIINFLDGKEQSYYTLTKKDEIHEELQRRKNK